MDNAPWLAPGIRVPSRRAEGPRGRSIDPGERNLTATRRPEISEAAVLARLLREAPDE
jgi:hypothetical protein